MSTHESPRSNGIWARHHWVGTAEQFHATELPSERAVWHCEVTSPAIILGSTQSVTDIDEIAANRLGLSIAKRRSGGGAVFVHPNQSVWIDVTIARNDPLWVDDVSQSMLWLGDVFTRALSQWVHATTYRGPFEAGQDGRAVCFASTSPGEVFVGNRKLVGISQRRGRDGARLQCVLYRSWQPELWVSSLTSPDVRERIAKMQVATVDAPASEIFDALMQSL